MKIISVKCELQSTEMPYMTLADETEIVHSQIVEKDGMKMQCLASDEVVFLIVSFS